MGSSSQGHTKALWLPALTEPELGTVTAESVGCACSRGGSDGQENRDLAALVAACSSLSWLLT